MLRLWRDIHAEHSPVSTSAAVSIAVHAVLITASVVATQRPPNLAGWSEVANRPYYIPPPNRAPGRRPSVEHIQFVALAPQGLGAGLGPPAYDANKPFGPGSMSELAGNAGKDSVPTTPPDAGAPGADSVLTQVEVDSAVRLDPRSAAPSYPPALLKKNIQGTVSAQYVVDTTGQAVTASLLILQATDSLFAQAVREALPRMLFAPAKLGPKKVRQLVEQVFTFRIQPPKIAEAARKP